MPLWSTGSSVVCQPRRASAFNVLSTASCSMAVAIRWRRPLTSSASAAPRMAKLSLSVPPLVKTTSDGSAPISAATGAAGVVERRLGALPEMVHARRVAELLPQRCGHAVDDRAGRREWSRCDRGRCVARVLPRIVAFRVTLSSKTTRQDFRAADILSGLPPRQPPHFRDFASHAGLFVSTNLSPAGGGHDMWKRDEAVKPTSSRPADGAGCTGRTHPAGHRGGAAAGDPAESRGTW